VAGPAYRLTRARLDLLGPELVDSARRIGAQLHPAGADATPGTEASVSALPGHWAFHGAHPLWSADGRRLWWADVLAPSVHVMEEGVDRELCAIESPIVGLLRAGEDVIAVHERGATRVGADGQTSAHTPWLQGQVLAVCNGAEQEIWAAVALPEAGTAIGRVRDNATLDVQWRIGEPVHGLGWHADAGALYATAQGSGAILVMQPGQAAVRRLASVPKGSGRVCGLAFDSHGGIWTALCDGWSIARFTPDGQLDRVVGLPVPCATDLVLSPAADGEGRESLTITTARHSVALDMLASAPLSGRLFSMVT